MSTKPPPPQRDFDTVALDRRLEHDLPGALHEIADLLASGKLDGWLVSFEREGFKMKDGRYHHWLKLNLAHRA